VGGSSIIIARKFKQELDIYTIASGSKINYAISQIFGWNFTLREMTDISRILEIAGKSQWDSFKYLGIPISKSSPKFAQWLPLIDKLENRINLWRYFWLNMAGKLVLIKSMLSSIPIYQCSTLLAPARLISKFDSFLRRFLWKGGKHNENKLPLVNRGKISKPLLEGGIQIHDLRTQNLALSAKIL